MACLSFERRSSSSNLGARNWKALRFLARYGQVNAELMMKSDSELERDVKEELQWNPDLDARDIAVSARNGAVTLTGFVRSYTDKYDANQIIIEADGSEVVLKGKVIGPGLNARRRNGWLGRRPE